MTQETSPAPEVHSSLTQAQAERFAVLNESAIHIHTATRAVLEQGFDAEGKNKFATALALAYVVVASNLLYANGDIDVDAMMPLVQQSHAALQGVLKHQPQPEAKPATTEEKGAE